MAQSCLEIPSQIKDSFWVFVISSDMRLDSRNRCSESIDMVGKWMLFLNKTEKIQGDKTLLDINWEKIRNLVETNQLYSAKCSTGLENPNANEPNTGVIIVYTKNYEDKADVKRAADLIIKSLDYKAFIYYKTDQATLSGQYSKSTNKRVSLYRHSYEGEFSESIGKNWKVLND